MPVVIAIPAVVALTFAMLVSFMVLYALRRQAVYFVQACGMAIRRGVGLLRWIPYVGAWLEGQTVHALDVASHYVEKSFSDAAEGVARPLTNFFAHTAALVEHVAFTWRYLADATYEALYKLRHAVIPALIFSLTAPWRLMAEEALRLGRFAERLAGRAHAQTLGEIRVIERDIAKLAGTSAAALEHAYRFGYEGVIDHPLHVLGRWWGDTWRSLRRRVRLVEELLAAGVLTGVVLRVLARQLPWFRCANVNRTMRQLCGTPYNFLNDLLTLAADFFVLTNICHVIPWLERGFEDVATPLISALARVGAGVCDSGYARGPDLGVPELHLPSVQTGPLHLV